MGKHLIVGASGQLGVELMLALQAKHGPDQVLLADLRAVPHPEAALSESLTMDATDADAVRRILERDDIGTVYMLVAMLSARGESMPLDAWELNMKSLLVMLEAAKDGLVDQVFWPSSIAVFGPDAPKENTPQHAALVPTTVYGLSKVSGELWCQYYHDKYGVDVRSLRYPGLIGYRSQPGGGTTDYAVEAFAKARAGESMVCYLNPDERLPMMSMDDAIRATIQLLEAPDVGIRTSYNLSGCSFSPRELEECIQSQIPDFVMEYSPDHRQGIAASWPDSIDDSQAQDDWNWRASHDLQGLMKYMFQGLGQLAETENRLG
ncbi:MAG: NAD-dependent epimerase/dehydratase family protein [Bacteroidetes bacterium]|nr:NAD-dependent epimerase/dehydratase family protein [Bacteroidota bacterium]MDA0902967.1 NAD-dependent epimerase/dehydratase family protein [Bacteroidota bacterium]MDA1241617.1 NAD-dependent epimerase/dehydratase family protein [Bacteroidota bacterium]